jgi:hypothetical protein
MLSLHISAGEAKRFATAVPQRACVKYPPAVVSQRATGALLCVPLAHQVVHSSIVQTLPGLTLCR